MKRVFLHLVFLPPGPYLESCLEESRGWDTALVWGRISAGCLAPLPLAMLVASAALYALERSRDLRHSNLGCRAFGTSHDGVEDARSLGSVRLRLPSGCRSWADRQRDCAYLTSLCGGSNLTLALRVDTKLGPFLRAESILLPLVHDELGDI